jgi:P27 family predicted phage terminase small subunit
MAHHTRGRKSPPRAAADALSRVPKVPAWFTDEAAAEWRRVMPQLVERGTLTAADLSACELYCSAVGDALVARKTIATEGATIETRLGDTKRHPAWTTLRESTTAARQWAAELGLTPASRSRVATEAPDDDDSASDLGL